MKKKAAVIAAAVCAAAIIAVSSVPALSEDASDDILIVHETDVSPRDAASAAIANEGSVHITLVKDGVPSEYTYFPVTCAEFFRFAGIALTDLADVSVPADTVLTDGMLIEITTSNTVERVEEITTPCEYDYIDVDTIPMGTTQIITAGTDGKKRVTYLDRYVGGEYAGTEVAEEEMITEGTRGSAYRGVGGYVTSKAGVTYHYSYVKIMEATAYTYIPGLTTMTCATGARLAKGCVAVDPRVIPMKTKMFITSDNFEYGYGSAEDTGGAIKGNIVDLAFMSYNECVQFGRRMMRVYILD